jgi:hypothetical protein
MEFVPHTSEASEKTSLLPLISQVEASEFSHVVVMLTSEGICWRSLPEKSCLLIAEILADLNVKVLTREDFLSILSKTNEDESC